MDTVNTSINALMLIIVVTIVLILLVNVNNNVSMLFIGVMNCLSSLGSLGVGFGVLVVPLLLLFLGILLENLGLGRGRR